MTNMSRNNSVKEDDIRSPVSTEGILKPILLTLKIFGIYFDPAPGKNKVDDAQKKLRTRTKSFSWIGHRVYCHLVLLILWFNFVRNIVGFFPLDEEAPLKGLIAMWYLQCAINATILVVSCHKLQRFQLFYKYWDGILHDRSTESIHCKYQCTLKMTKVISFIGWVVLLANVALLDVVILQTYFSKLQEITGYMLHPFKQEYWVRVMTAILLLYEFGAWIFPAVFVMVMSHMIRTQFIQFNKCLSWHIDQANDFIPVRLAELRSYYLKLCKAVEIINETFKWMMGFSLLLTISIACFTSYQLISNLEDVTISITFLFYLGSCFLFIGVLCLGTSELHKAAQSSLGVLLTAGTKDATPEQLGQLNLFLTKLSAVPVGFTVVDFFLITKEFLLTVTGLYLTYFFILLQFKTD